MIARTKLDGQENAAAMMEDLEGRVLFAMTPSIPIPPPETTKVLIALNQPVQPTTSGIIAVLIGL